MPSVAVPIATQKAVIQISWFKVDDKLHDHHKANAAKKAAMGVWVLAGSWSADNLTDGFIPARVLARWGTATDAKRLVEAGLWFPDTHKGETGWRFHDWNTFQPTRSAVEDRRKKNAEKIARWRDRKEAEREEM